MKIADGELRQILLHDLKLPAQAVRELIADSRQSGHRLLQVVIHSKIVPLDDIARAHAKRIGVPFINLEDKVIDTKIVHRLPHQIAAKYHLICFDETTTSVKIAMADPRNEAAKKAVRDYTGKTVRRYLATDSGLRHAFKSYAKRSAPLPLSSRDLLAIILEQAQKNGSKDIHFEPSQKEVIIKRRLGTKLITMSRLPIDRYQGIIALCKLQTKNQVTDTKHAHHGKFNVLLAGLPHTVVISILPVIGGQKLVVQLIPPAESIPSLSDIGYLDKQAQQIQTTMNDGRGLIIIAGGKSAKVPETLARLATKAAAQPLQTVAHINQLVKYIIPGVNQIEVSDTLSHDEIVETLISQGPQVIVTDSLGKGKTAEQLIDFSIGHHLVISGLYGTTIESVIKRLQNYPMSAALLAASLRLIIVQHQAEILCKSCRMNFKPVGPLKTALHKQFYLEGQPALYRQGKGCIDCHGGIKNAFVIPELINISSDIQQLIATGADFRAIKSILDNQDQLAKQLGKLLTKGLISVDQATQLVA